MLAGQRGRGKFLSVPVEEECGNGFRQSYKVEAWTEVEVLAWEAGSRAFVRGLITTEQARLIAIDSGGAS